MSKYSSSNLEVVTDKVVQNDKRILSNVRLSTHIWGQMGSSFISVSSSDRNLVKVEVVQNDTPSDGSMVE